MKRTPGTVTRCCPTCKRDGWKEEQWFSLYTEEEWGRPNSTMDGLRKKYPGYEVCLSRLGSSIYKAAEEAKQIAELVRRPVVFEFNKVDVVVTSSSDPSEVVGRWWKERYGETPEESFQRDH
jgi:hypothetical protein